MDTSNEELPLEIAERIDQLADEFERQLIDGQSPRIENVLRDNPALPRDAVLGELIRLELELRSQATQPPTAGEFEDRFPKDLQLIHSVMAAFGSTLPDSQQWERERTFGLPESIGRFEIIRSLGCGGFGVVYLARDPQLDRLVAIKCPLPKVGLTTDQVDGFLREARAAAQLRHPALISVFDARLEQGQPYIVYEFIRGESLASWSRRRELSFEQIVGMFIPIVDALRHAHEKEVIHCDLKLSNIMIDQDGAPHIADFGLSRPPNVIGESELQLSGTPAMMAPEQIDGRPQFIDMRTDVWAIGVMLYELLVGRRPFGGNSRQDLFEHIQSTAPVLPQAINKRIPVALARICMKCLEKDPNARFSTAGELRFELNTWLVDSQRETDPDNNLVHQETAEIISLGLVPRGLRAYTRSDSHFFPQLLPGPRDELGLPESIRFWIDKIESTETQPQLTVGLIYGPSGSGKSSFVRAGLLPRLDDAKTHSIYWQMGSQTSAADLIEQIRSQVSELDHIESLDSYFDDLVSGKFGTRQQKVVLLLDQFEQWLHAHHEFEDNELVNVLKRCDGTNLQAILIVRDDFFASVNLLFQELGVPLREGHNYALIPRFTENHARRVLELLGQGYGALGPELSDHNRSFIEQAVQQLCEEGRVVGLRVALLAEMMKHRRWEPRSLESVGGVEGVGVAYLEESIGAPQAAPHRRAHEAAIRRVLAELVPPAGTSIRGATKSQVHLQSVANLDDSQQEREVMRILDQELHLITPVDATEPRLTLRANGKGKPTSSSSQLFQLTHDYLVPSLRIWLTKKQRETRRGRAELKLDEFATLWTAKADYRFLPGLLEWVELKWWSMKCNWNSAQRDMMEAAGHLHARRLFASLLAVVCGVLLFNAWRADDRATDITGRLLDAEFERLPVIAQEVRAHRRWVLPKLQSALAQFPEGSPRYLKIRLATLDDSPQQLSEIIDSLPTYDAKHMRIIEQMLRPYQDLIIDDLWSIVQSANEEQDEALLRASSLLAGFDPRTADKWTAIAEKLINAMFRQTSRLAYWAEHHLPVKHHLLQPLGRIFRNTSGEYSETHVSLATELVAEFAAEDLEILTDALMDSSVEQFNRLFSVFERHGEPGLSMALKELDREATYRWDDAEYSEPLAAIQAAIGSTIDQFSGMLTERFAFCQALPLDQFRDLSNRLGTFHFRPTRLRPYALNGQVLCAAIWWRDGGRWHVEKEFTAAEIDQLQFADETSELVPIDVAGYLDPPAGGERERFCVLYGENHLDLKDLHIYAGVPDSQQWKREATLAREQMRFLPALQSYQDASGSLKYCGIVARHPTRSAVSFRNLTTKELVDNDDWNRILWDIAMCPVDKPQLATSYHAITLSDWKAMDNRQDWLNSRFIYHRLAEAIFHLRDLEYCKSHCDSLIKSWSHRAAVYGYRSRIHAVQGQYEEAQEQARIFARLCLNEPEVCGLWCKVMAYFGEENPWLAKLEALVQSRPNDVEIHYQRAAAYSVCAAASEISGSNVQADEYRWKAVEALHDASRTGFSDWLRVNRNVDFDPLRNTASFYALRLAAPPQVGFGGVRCICPDFDSVEIHGVSANEHLERSMEMAAAGYRPVSIGLAAAGANVAAASVWHRPTIRETDKERLAIRQANAAVAAFKLGSAEAVWPLLQFRPDPRLRTRIIHQLQRTSCDPDLLTNRLRMEQEVSRRRALIVALGEYDLKDLHADLLKDIVLDWYENDIDAGVHGACEWLLRKWGWQAEMDQVNARLATGKPEGERKWYRLKSADHTFSVIDAPLKFMRGPSRASLAIAEIYNENRVWTRLPRRFAVATMEVTAEQLHELLDAIKVIGPQSERTAWKQRCAAGGTNWKYAALYCEMLNFKEHIPGSQWPTNLPDSDSEKVFLAQNYLSRTGYRLPTESEWEYACRAGTTTARYFGESEEFMDKYVWFEKNSQMKSWPVGSLKPNDLGLFDMLGNVEEWGLERPYDAFGYGSLGDDLEDMSEVASNNNRCKRGASYAFRAADVYVANHSSTAPFARHGQIGIRVVRTMPVDDQ